MDERLRREPDRDVYAAKLARVALDALELRAQRHGPLWQRRRPSRACERSRVPGMVWHRRHHAWLRRADAPGVRHADGCATDICATDICATNFRTADFYGTCWPDAGTMGTVRRVCSSFTLTRHMD